MNQIPGRSSCATSVSSETGAIPVWGDGPGAGEPIRLAWDKNFLTLSAEHISGKEIRIHYLEAYCRAGSSKRQWELTTIGHTTRLVSVNGEWTHLQLECTLKDGVMVRHDVRSERDNVDFQIVATNPTAAASEAHWAQPCVRLDGFTGRNATDYLEKCFVFLDGQLTRMPTPEWETAGLYTPGQVWRRAGVDARDVNPRPLSRQVPSNGLIGCYSADEKLIFAIAFDPWQELFQGVQTCLHSDFRIGGLQPGETKRVRGKMYVVGNDVTGLVRRYEEDFAK